MCITLLCALGDIPAYYVHSVGYLVPFMPMNLEKHRGLFGVL